MQTHRLNEWIHGLSHYCNIFYIYDYSTNQQNENPEKTSTGYRRINIGWTIVFM